MESLIGRRRPHRAHSAMDTLSVNPPPRRNQSHLRHTSSTTLSGDMRLCLQSPTPESTSLTDFRLCETQDGHDFAALGHSIAQSRPTDDSQLGVSVATGMISPPTTPLKGTSLPNDAELLSLPEIDVYDFEKLDYELQRARVLGRGLWSTVLLADGKHSPREQRQVSSGAPPTPPSSPRKAPHQAAPSSVFAVKVPARPDAINVFKQEAMILTDLM